MLSVEVNKAALRRESDSRGADGGKDDPRRGRLRAGMRRTGPVKGLGRWRNERDVPTESACTHVFCFLLMVCERQRAAACAHEGRVDAQVTRPAKKRTLGSDARDHTVAFSVRASTPGLLGGAGTLLLQ